MWLKVYPKLWKVHKHKAIHLCSQELQTWKGMHLIRKVCFYKSLLHLFVQSFCLFLCSYAAACITGSALIGLIFLKLISGHLNDFLIVFLSIISSIASALVCSFAQTSWLIFVGRCVCHPGCILLRSSAYIVCHECTCSIESI